MASGSAPAKRPRPGPWPSSDDHSNNNNNINNNAVPSSWAKRSGFKTRFSEEATSSPGDSGQIPVLQSRERDVRKDLESGPTPTSRPPPPPSTIPPPPSATVPPPPGAITANGVNEPESTPPSTAGTAPKKQRDSDVPNGGQQQRVRFDTVPRPSREEERVDIHNSHDDDDEGFFPPHAHMKYELRETPGLVPVLLYGLQHYVSIVGSLILIPLVIVPAMGGNSEDTAKVVSTVLLLSGVTTLLHTHFGSRLPLVQGPSFVYLAPALAIINSDDFQGLARNERFKHIMRALQGAILVSSAFQMIVGYSGLMSIILRLINPVVVAPTAAAVGLSFYSYGFTQVGTCLEIGLPQILLVIIFALYLRKISIFGHRIFQIYAVPLGLAITWAYAFLLTEAGIYNYKGCDINVPESNIVSEACRKRIPRMKSCRVDTSHALRASPWFRFPYPFQWGIPVFHWKMVLVMCVVSIIASVDSVGSYHATSLLVASKPPSPGVLSRGIGLEGFSSVLAGIWGTGTASTTLTENVHTIAVTRMGSRRSVELGACVLIALSLIGKIGGFIASIPLVIVAALLCFMWTLLAALGLSNLRYSDARSSRNIIIVGLSLFLSLSIPAYFQQYGTLPNANRSAPSYFQPYIVASHGPLHTKNSGANFVLNTLLSFHMVIAFLIAVVLDNTVPGSRQERGVYVWTRKSTARQDREVAKDYELPFKCSRGLRWVKWVGF